MRRLKPQPRSPAVEHRSNSSTHPRRASATVSQPHGPMQAGLCYSQRTACRRMRGSFRCKLSVYQCEMSISSPYRRKLDRAAGQAQGGCMSMAPDHLTLAGHRCWGLDVGRQQIQSTSWNQGWTLQWMFSDTVSYCLWVASN